MLNKILSIQFLLTFSSALFTLIVIATFSGAWSEIKTFFLLFVLAPLIAGFIAIKLEPLHPISNLVIGVLTSIILAVVFVYFIISH